MQELEHTIGFLLKSQYFAVLNSVANGQPYCNLVSFATAGDAGTLLFVTGRNTRKYRNMTENPLVSMLIDNRTNQPADVSRAIAVTAIGEVQETGEDEDELKKLFLARHPHLEDFVRDTTNTLMRIAVREYIVSGFTETRRFTIER